MGGRANLIGGETPPFIKFFSAEIGVYVCKLVSGKTDVNTAGLLRIWMRIDVPKGGERFQHGCISYSWYIPAVTEKGTITA